jgi:hypothetical protein
MPAGPRPTGEVDQNGLIPVPAGACVTVPAGRPAAPLLSLPPTGVAIEAGPAPISDIRMTRFAINYYFPVDLQRGLAPHSAATIRTPPDRAEQVPWKLQLESAGPTTACGLNG